ncbi:MAG: RNA methyltransferase [Gammaproteobacteria bacterium]|nr:RNA methyltransferase [Gammaproteobacteria bacterium]
MQSFNFALARTAFPENIGSAARALAVMGFDHLSLIAPVCDYQDERAITLASNAADTVLKNTTIYPDVRSWSASCDLVIGLSARTRDLGPIFFELPQLPEILNAPAHAARARIGFLFGCERSGLDNDELSYCHYVCGIPTQAHTQYRSLNLAQAVQIVAYTAMLFLNQKNQDDLKMQSHSTEVFAEDAKRSFDRFLEQLVYSDRMQSFRQRTTPEQTLRRLRQLFQNSIDSQASLDFLYGFLRILSKN